MATLSNRTFYEGGKTPSSAVVGFTSSKNRVVRYNLNLDSNDRGNKIKVVFAGNPNDVAIGYGAPLGSFSEKLNDEMSFYFAITEDPNAFSDAGYHNIAEANGKAIFEKIGGSFSNENMKYKVSCEGNVTLNPDIQYYFWVFPGFSNLPDGNYTWGWVYWNNVSISVDISGSVGGGWVETQNGSKLAAIYVRMEGKTYPSIPYIRENGEYLVSN